MKINIFIIGLLLSVTSLRAQTAADIQKTEQAIQQDGKYALLVMKVQHLKAAILTGEDFKKRSPETDFQIVACGELVKQIAEDDALKKLVKEAVSTNGIKILVCGLSLQQFSVDAALLPAETPVTQNGLIYMFGLQESGYKTITL